MDVNANSADPLTCRLLPQYNPNERDRQIAWAELLNADLIHQLKRFIQYKNHTTVADDDILQDTLLLAWIKVENGEYELRQAPFAAYLKGVARYKIKEAGRQHIHVDIDLYAEALPDPRAETARPDLRVADELLQAALNELPARRRDVLLLSELYDYSGEEIAAHFHIRADLVRKDKSLALQQLRRTLAPELPDALSSAA